MKKFVLTMAAMLLTSASVFSQSSTTLKGDVNGDGRVDVTDVTAAIGLVLDGKDYGYFYFGTTEPTASNFQSLPGVVASYTSVADAAGTTATVSDGEALYLLCPASWLAGKTVELKDESGNSVDFSKEKDNVTISGYVILKTSVLNDKKIVGLKTPTLTYKYYVGKNSELGTTDYENTNYSGFWESNSSISKSSEAEIKTALTGKINVGSGAGDLVIVAPESVINSIASITNEIGFNIAMDKLAPSNGYVTLLSANSYSGDNIIITMK